MTDGGSIIVTVSGRDVGLEALLRRMQDQMRQADATGNQLARTTGSTLAQGQQRAAGSTTSLLQAQARLAVAQGDLAEAVNLYNQALRTQGVGVRESIQLKTQLARVESRLAQETTRAAQASQQVQTAFNGNSAAVSKFSSSLNGLNGVLGKVGLALGAQQLVQFGIDAIQVGAVAEQTATRFDSLAVAANTTGDALLKALRSASAGTISDLNLQLAANRAQLLGVASSAREFSTLMAIARDRAQQMGISTTQAFNDLITGLGRGSALILDNLGITVSVTEANATYAAQIGKNVAALTEQEQKQALINAVLTQGQASLNATGGAIESNAAKIERLSAMWDNLKASIGGALADGILPTTDAVSGLIGAFDGSRESILRYVDAASAYMDANQQVAGINRSAAESILTWVGVVDEQVVAAANVAAAYDTAAQAALATGQAMAAATPPAFQLAGAYDAAVAAAIAYQAPGDAFNASLSAHAGEAALASSETQILAARQALLFQAAQDAALGMNVGSDAAGNLARAFGITTGEADVLIGRLRELARLQNTLAFARGTANIGAQGSGVGAFLVGQEEVAAEKIKGVFTGLSAGARKYEETRTRTARAGGAARLSDQQKLNNSLLADQEKYNDQSIRATLEHEQRILEIEEEFQKRSLEQQRKNEVSKRQSRADFYDSLTSATADVGPEVAAQLSAAYEQAYAEAQAMAQAGNQKLAAEYLALKEQQIRDELEFQKKVAAAREAGDKAEVARLEAIHKLRQDAQAEEERQLRAEGDTNVNQRNEALGDEGERFADQQGKIGTAAEQAAERKVNAAVRAGKAVDIENAKLLEQERILGRIGGGATVPGGAAATGPVPAGATAAPTSPVDALASVAAQLQSIVDAIHTQGGNITKAQGETTAAVRSSGSRAVQA